MKRGDRVQNQNQLKTLDTSLKLGVFALHCLIVTFIKCRFNANNMFLKT